VAQAEPAVELVRDRGRRGKPRRAGAEAIVIDRLRRTLLWRHVAEVPARGQLILHEIAQADRPDFAAISELTGLPLGSIGPTRGRMVRRLLETAQAWPAFAQ
jgi:hypothetical protein